MAWSIEKKKRVNEELKILYDKLNNEYWGGVLPDIIVEINTRRSKVGGMAWYRNTLEYLVAIKIEISGFLYEYHQNNQHENELIMVMKHEMCHIATLSHNHDKVFEKELERVGGCRFFSNKIIKDKDKCKSKKRYYMKCEICGKIHIWKRKPNRWDLYGYGAKTKWYHQKDMGYFIKIV